MPVRSRALSLVRPDVDLDASGDGDGERHRGVHRGLFGAAWIVLVGLVLGACAAKDRPSPLVEPTEASTAQEAESAPLVQLAEEQDAAEDYDDDGHHRSSKDAPREKSAEGGELDLAAYERLLVDQELRLRSAGVALRGDQVAAKSEAGAGRGGLAGGATTSPPSSAPSGTGKTATTKTSAPPKTVKKKTSSSSSRPSMSGDSKPSTPNPEPSRNSDEADRCITICDLAKTTCELAQRICDLASRHPDEDRYSQVCERASDDCELARNACESCLV